MSNFEPQDGTIFELIADCKKNLEDFRQIILSQTRSIKQLRQLSNKIAAEDWFTKHEAWRSVAIDIGEILIQLWLAEKALEWMGDIETVPLELKSDFVETTAKRIVEDGSEDTAVRALAEEYLKLKK